MDTCCVQTDTGRRGQPGRSRGVLLIRLLSGPFGSLHLFGMVFMIVFFILRTVLLIDSIPLIDHAFLSLLKIYVVGFLFDGVTCFFAVLPAVIYFSLVPARVLRWRVSRCLALGIYFLAIFLILFNGVADWLFWKEFGSQFNFLVVDYLLYTREMIGNAMESYPVGPIVGVLLIAAFSVTLITGKRFLLSHTSSEPILKRLRTGLVYLAVPCISLLLLGTSMAEVSQNRYNNELSKNCLFSVVASFFYNSIEYDEFYLTREENLVFPRLRSLLKSGNSRYISDDVLEITRTVTGKGRGQRKNVIIMVVESLSARFLGVFGNKENLTPNLDSLAAESLIFRNMYATGTRTTRGLEAVAMSVPPTPGRSLVKRPRNENMFTVGQIFRNEGYETKFIYGGFGYFDNMRSFFSGNGFQVVDRTDMDKDKITFSTVWGVCDENLFERVLEESDRSFSHDKPFLSVVMTTSNHRPYTYPRKIDIPSGSGREGAVKYTDYAIGQFVRKARAKRWFNNTVFIIIADHCANSAGKVEVPVEKYHIPLIIYSPGFIKPGECLSLCSQIDLSPTLLGLLNISYKSRFFGQDILAYPQDRAFLGTYQKLGLFTGQRLTLLEPGRKSLSFRVLPDRSQVQTDPEDDLLFDAIAYYQSASELLKRGGLSVLPEGHVNRQADPYPPTLPNGNLGVILP